MFLKILDGTIKRLKHAVMRSYSLLAINAEITDDNFHYTECGMAKFYRSLVNITLDNKALYVYEHKNE